MKTMMIAFVTSAFVTTVADAAPFQWTTGSGGNGHWYDFVDVTPDSNFDAEAAAESSVFMGMLGYLATITSQAEQDFLNANWPGPRPNTGQFRGYNSFLIGASDRASEGTFSWIGGPEEGQPLGYTNWSSGEPNNNAGNEDYVTAWWGDNASGVWNDVPSLTFSYVVEYGPKPTTPVPVPAGFPLFLSGLSILGAMRRFG